MRRCRPTLLVLLGAAFALAVLPGCEPEKAAQAPTAVAAASPTGKPSLYPRTLTDTRGKPLTLAGPPQRIVSLMPSNTEILYALDVGSRLVMDTTACDYPPQAKTIPHLNAVQPDIEPILAQKPDLVIADDKYNDRLIDALEKAGIPTLVVGIRSVDQTYAAIRLIGSAIDAEKQAAALTAAMRRRIEKVRAATAHLAKRRTVLIMYGDSPIYTSGPETFISEIIGIAGGVNVIASSLPGDIVSAEKVVELQPDVIIASEDVQKQAANIPGWKDAVPAVQSKQYFTLEAPLIRPGPRLPEAVERLERYLHPELTL